jgi:hypothetical protein
MLCRSSLLFCALSLLLLVPAQALPMHFEENLGQTDPRVRFMARGAGYAFFITGTETVTMLQKDGVAPAVVRMQLLGASGQPHVEGREPFEGKSHYLAGNDPSRWRTNVPQFGKVRMAEVYRVSPSTNVPFLLSRSLIQIAPSTMVMRAWWRDTVGSASTTRLAGARSTILAPSHKS